MKRRAFTLVELMVVIAILGLLMAILLPSMSQVYSVARSTICKGNLRRLGDAFAASSASRAIADGKTATVKSTVSPYPRPMSWPANPRNIVPDVMIYQCPEDELNEGVAALNLALGQLEYHNEYGKFPMDTTDGLTSFYLARRGENEQGGYTEYLLQDDEGNGQLGQMDFHGWIDIDGFCRVYDSGSLYVFDSIPTTPDFSGATCPGQPNTCGDINGIYYNGEPLFGPGDEMLRNHRGETVELPGWNVGLTNYGINSYAHKYPFGNSKIVLVDYEEELIVDVDKPVEAQELLLQSDRHLGRVNYLLGDGTVKTDAPLAVSPLLEPSSWKDPS